MSGPDNISIEKSVSDERRALLREATSELIRTLEPNELKTMRAILLIGSTAKGTATEKSDVDIWLATMGSFSVETWHKIRSVFQKHLGNIDIEVTGGPIERGSSGSKFVTRSSDETPDVPAAWEFLYVQSTEFRNELDAILKESLSEYQDSKQR